MRKALLPTIATILVAAYASAESVAGTPAPLPERIKQTILPGLVRVISLAGQSDVEKTVNEFETLIGRKFHVGTGPFEVDERAYWRSQFSPLAKAKVAFENAELVEMKALTTQFYRVNLVAHGKHGPFLFQCDIYEFGGKTTVTSLKIAVNATHVATYLDNLKNRLNVKYDLTRRHGPTAQSGRPTSRK